MSRVIVQNLPKQITEDEIRNQFSKRGNITDIKLKYKNGEFRRFAFIGYENEQDAEAACDYFNNTFIKQSKIVVNICQDYGSGNKPVSWAEKNKLRKEKNKQPVNGKEEEDSSLGNSKKKKKKKKNKNKEVLNKQLLYKDDPEFSEFLKADEKVLSADSSCVANKKSTGSDGEEEEEADDKEEENEKQDKLALKSEVSDLDYLKSLKKSTADGDDVEGKKQQKKQKVWKEFYTVIIRASGMCKSKQRNQRTFNKKSVKAFLKPLKYKSLRIPRHIKLVAYVGFQTEREMKRALEKDKSFLDGVRVHVLKYEKPSGAAGGSGNSAPWSASEEKLKNADPVAESGKMFVRNLWYAVTEDDVRQLFSSYGEITDISLPICKFTRRPKGFATVSFLFPEHAVKAMTELDGKNFKGRVLHILPAIEEEKRNKENMSFKEKKAQEKKATAGSWHNWNTLFLGSSAVVDIMAEKYNRSKQEILNSEGKQSVAVNLALGEAQIVDETKRFLEDNGISLEAFSQPGVQRSATVILVKNLPAKTTAQELSEIFGRHGELGRVVFPSSGVTGIVEYLDPGEAKTAFRSLAYSKFKYSPLYLEWAPIQAFKTEFTPELKKEKDLEQETEDEVQEKTGDQETVDTSLDPEPDTTVYVKNLNYSTTEEVLKQHFERLGTVYSVLIAKRRGLSQGYGFVQYLRKRDAQKALKELNESALEDHTLQVKLSEKTLTNQVKSARRMLTPGTQTSTKVAVKNIPFQATSKEVKQLFAPFGELKTVRLPSKPDKSEHRGFGFVDFVSREDAKKAFEALRLSTHLYDRRLVLEWAKQDETVEELRKKTADHFLASGPPKKRMKVQVTSSLKLETDEV